jgi:hypothetical protein
MCVSLFSRNGFESAFGLVHSISKALSIRQVPSGMLLIENRIGWFFRPRRSAVVVLCTSVDGCVRRKALAAVWLLFSGVRLDQLKGTSKKLKFLEVPLKQILRSAADRRLKKGKRHK